MSADLVARGLAARLASPTELRAEQAGATPGDGASAGRLTRALQTLGGQGGGTVRLSPGQRYDVALQDTAIEGVGYTIPPYSGYLVVPPEPTHFDGNGGRLRVAGGGPGSCAVSATGVVLHSDAAVGPLAAGTKVIPLAEAGATAHWAVGDLALWRLGDHPLDPPETANWGYARVRAVDPAANSVTLDRPLTRPWDGTGTQNRHLQKVRAASDQLVDRIAIVPPPNNGGSWNGLLSRFAIRPRFPETVIDGAQIGAGVQYVEQASFGRLVIENASGPGSDSRQGIRFAEATARIEQLITRNVASGAVVLEGASEVLIDYHEDISIDPTPFRPIVGAGFHSRLHIDRARYVGSGQNILIYNKDPTSIVTFGNVRLEFDTAPLQMPTPARDCRELSVRFDGKEELYLSSRAQWFTARHELGAASFATRNFPPGLIAGAQIYLGGGATAADFTALYLGHSGTTLGDLVPKLPTTPSPAAVDLTPLCDIGAAVSGNWLIRDTPVTLVIIPSDDFTGSGKFLVLNVLIVPNILATDNPWGGDADVRAWAG
jgi:hypothetical protein